MGKLSSCENASPSSRTNVAASAWLMPARSLRSAPAQKTPGTVLRTTTARVVRSWATACRHSRSSRRNCGRQSRGELHGWDGELRLWNVREVSAPAARLSCEPRGGTERGRKCPRCCRPAARAQPAVASVCWLERLAAAAGVQAQSRPAHEARQAHDPGTRARLQGGAEGRGGAGPARPGGEGGASARASQHGCRHGSAGCPEKAGGGTSLTNTFLLAGCGTRFALPRRNPPLSVTTPGYLPGAWAAWAAVPLQKAICRRPRPPPLPPSRLKAFGAPRSPGEQRNALPPHRRRRTRSATKAAAAAPGGRPLAVANDDAGTCRAAVPRRRPVAQPRLACAG